ncbi:restriction endonuclease subunit S [Blautia faecis]|uniref:restriction endonuclease subunit S n=1 Tax=Blautia faecis TaxID=871665 RepID=UPI001EDC4FC1|nr:restriction endonuclease subunit S [Blautia faecis]MCG4751213.1 restriction endonuclease subunit S [Blautia faecis]
MENVSSSNGLEKYPKLRFPKFDEPWRAEKLSDFADRVTRKNSKNETDLPLTISSKDGLVDQVSYFNKTVASKDMSGYYLLKNGEYAYNKSYSVGYDFGSIKRLDRYPMGALSTLYICFALKRHDSDFIKAYFDSLKWYREIYRISAEGARNHGLLNVPTEDFFDTKHYLPENVDEQRKIADFLIALDRRIEAQQSLVDNLKKYKRGLLHEILCEKIKVTKSVWNVHKIGDYLNSKNIKQLPTPDAPLMAFTATGGVCDKGERYDRGFLVKDASTKLYKRTDLNDFIYSSNNLDVGSIGLNLYGSAVISDVYEIFSISGADPWFISEAIQQKSVLHQILKYRQGCLYGQYRIYAEDFLEVSIRVPPLETQKQIGTIFSRIEYKIKSEQALLDNLERAKTFFLQQLFI